MEFPDLESSVWQPYKDRGVVVLGLSGDGLFGKETRETIEAFVDQTQVTFPVLLGDKSRNGYGDPDSRISPFPFDVVIDKHGKIRYMGTKFDSARITRLVEALTEES